MENYVSEKDIQFAKQFEDFVNGGMDSADEVGKQMANAHRYLQQEMFKVCIAYIKQLAYNGRDGRYDPRNEWSAKTANEIYKGLVEKDIIYDPEFGE